MRFIRQLADAAQVCSDVGFVAVDGPFECSVATAERIMVSERWGESKGLNHMVLAATSAFDSTRRRVTSRPPVLAESSSAVCSLKKSKRMNLRKKSLAS